MSLRYRIRNEVHEVLGTYSETEILRRIAKGKYSGEEEISAPPYDKWTKLSAHPEFYDAFLKRIYLEKYLPPEPANVEKKESTRASKKRATQHTRAARPEEKEDLAPVSAEAGKTVHGAAVGADLKAGTIQQELLDELFSKKSSVGGAKEPSLKLEISVPRAEAIPLPKAASADLPTEEEAGVQRAKRLRLPTDRRRRLGLAVGLVALLVVLFQFGSGTSDEPLVSATKQVVNDPLLESIKKPPHESALQAKVDSQLQEGIELYGLDSGPAYQEAVRVFEATPETELRASLLDARYGMAIGRLALLGKASEKQIKSATERIRRGRHSDPQQPLFYHAEALLALAAGKHDEARRLAENSLESDPGDAEALLLLGELRLGSSGLSEMVKELEEAAKRPSCAVRSNYLLGLAALESGEFLRAKTHALEALKYNPFHTGAFIVLADASSRRNEIKEAKAFYETAGRLARFGAPALVGRAYERLAELRKVTGSPAGADEANLLAYHYGKSDEQLERVKGLDHSHQKLHALAESFEFGPSYLSIQAESLEREQKFVEGVKFRYAAYLLAPEDGGLLLRLGESLEKRAASYADFRQVMGIYERAIQREPTLAAAYVRLGLIETDQYNFDRAYQLLTRAEEVAPDDASTHVALGKHFFKRQDYNQALARFLDAAKLNPSDSEVLYYAGVLRVLFKKESAKEAMRFFYQAYTLNPQNYDALVEWLKLKVEGHEKPFAIKFIRNLLETEPRNANLYWAYGEVYLANSEPYRAIAQFHKSLDIDNRSAKIRLALGRAQEAVGELEKAVAEYRVASLLDPRNGEGAYRAAKLLIQAKNYALAEEVLSSLTKVTPNYPGAYRELAQVYRAKQQADNAIAAMERECANNPRNTKFTLELGELYLEFQKPDKALAEFAKISNLPPVAKAPEFVYDKIRAYLMMSRTHRSLEKYELAEGAIKLALEIDAEDPELHKELGYVYHGLQRDKESVREFEYYLGRNPAAEDGGKIRGMINHMRIE